MLNNKKDNRFLDALNNIDDDLVDEATDDSVRPRRVGQIKKRSWLGRAAVGFASLAAMAAVCVGVVYVMRDLPTTPPGETLEGTSVFSENSESTDNNVTEQTQQGTELPVDTTEPALPPVIRHTFVDDLLEQEEWLNIDSYVNAADEEGYSQIAQLEGFHIADLDTSTETTTGVIFDRKPYMFGYEIALLGFKAWKDDIYSYADTVNVGELRIALVKSGRIETALPVYDPLSPDSIVYVDKRYFDKYIDLQGNIAVFRYLSNCRLPEALFFNIQMKLVSSDGEGGVDYEYRISQCWRSDVPNSSKREERSEILSPAVYETQGEISTSEGGYDTFFVIGDELTGTEYCFLGETYTVMQKDRLHDEFKPFDYDSIPVTYSDPRYEDFEDLADNFAHDMIVTERKLGEYTLCLVGDNFMRSENGVIYVYDPRIIIKKGDEPLASVPADLYWSAPFHCYLFSYNLDMDDLLSDPFMFGDDLFIFHGDHKDVEQIWCFDGENLYEPERSVDNTLGEEPSWTASLDWHHLKVREESLSFVYGYREFWFEIGDSGEYEYRVEWAEEPVE